jgi:hypothetical protein
MKYALFALAAIASAQTIQFKSNGLHAAYSASGRQSVNIDVFDVVDSGAGAQTWSYLIYSACIGIPSPGINQCLTAQGFFPLAYVSSQGDKHLQLAIPDILAIASLGVSASELDENEEYFGVLCISTPLLLRVSNNFANFKDWSNCCRDRCRRRARAM